MEDGLIEITDVVGQDMDFNGSNPFEFLLTTDVYIPLTVPHTVTPSIPWDGYSQVHYPTVTTEIVGYVAPTQTTVSISPVGWAGQDPEGYATQYNAVVDMPVEFVNFLVDPSGTEPIVQAKSISQEDITNLNKKVSEAGVSEIDTFIETMDWLHKPIG